MLSNLGFELSRSLDSQEQLSIELSQVLNHLDCHMSQNQAG